MLFRILASLALLVSILFMPFWVSCLLAIGAIIYFSWFFEAVILFLILDFIYGVAEARYFNIVFVSFILSVVLLFSVELIKKQTNFLKNKHDRKNY